MAKLQQSLKDSLHNLLLEAPAGICLLMGPQHVYEFANELYLKLVGFRDIIGKPIREAFPESDGQGFYELLDNVYATGTAFIGNEKLVKSYSREGSIRDKYFNFVYQPTRNSSGEIDGIFVHAVDVTEQVIARKKIEESEERIRLITNALPVLISYVDKNRLYRFNNTAYETWFGYSKSEIYGKHVRDVLGEQAYNKVKSKINKVLAGKPVHFEMSVPFKDAGTRWVAADFIPHFGNDNNILGFYATVSDVTAIKNAELLNYQLASIVQTTTDAIIGKTLTGIVTSWNAGAERMFGYKATEMIGESITKIIPEDRKEEEHNIINQILLNHNVDNFVTKRLTKKGVLLDTSITISPIKDNKGKIVGASKIARDITEDIKARKKIEESEKNLQRTTQHFALATSAAQVGIWSMDIATQKLEWSHLHRKMWGYTDLDINLTFEDWHKRIVAKDKEAALTEVARALRTRTLCDVSYRIKRADNEAIRWIHSTGRYFPEEALEPLTFTGVSIDITEEKRAEQALKESEERLRLATQTSSVGIWEWNVKTNKVRWDVQMFHIYGIEPTADGFIDYSTWRMTIAPEDLAEQEAILQDTIKSGSSSKRTFKIFRANDGMLCDIEAIEAARTNALGETEWVVGTNIDITERNRVTEKIKESEERFRSLAQTLPQLVWVTDAQGNAEFSSDRWKEYSGIEPNGEKEWKAIVHPEDYENINATWVHCLSTGDMYNAEVRLKNKDGHYKWHAVRGEPVLNKEHKIIKWVGAFANIHEQKTFAGQLEESVNVRTRQLNKANEMLEEQNNALQNLNKELQAFNYVSSHDLQEPLRKIQIFAGRIMDTEKENFSDTAKDYFKRMHDAAARMQTLIKDLLSFSRVSNSGKQFEVTDLDKIVEEIKVEFKEVLEEKNATIQATELCKVHVISFQFRQLLHNLISNALKFSKPDVPLRIIIKSIIDKGSQLDYHSLLPDTKYCHIVFADNGIGFDKKFSEKIFEVFQRLHSKEDYAGTGIGLAIVKKIVDNHNGIIRAESELGKGATFHIYLPE